MKLLRICQLEDTTGGYRAQIDEDRKSLSLAGAEPVIAMSPRGKFFSGTLRTCILT